MNQTIAECRFGIRLVLALALLLWAGSAPAHDSPEHTVEALTRLINQEGKTPARLAQRATELRVLGRSDEAVADLRAALAIDPQFLPATIELCRLHLARAESVEGLELSSRALGSSALAGPQRAELHFLQAQCYRQSGQTEEALRACERALLHPRPPVDWYLTRERLQSDLGLNEQRIADLHRAWTQTGSGVLRTAWIEALIDGRHWNQALAEIDPELNASRWQSSWLIRRGRVRLGIGEIEPGRADLRRAIEEIGQRLHPARPDLTLLADRAVAYRLLDERERAARDVAQARALGAEPWVLERLAENLRTPVPR